jgi:hypothetical protein
VDAKHNGLLSGVGQPELAHSGLEVRLRQAARVLAISA